MKMETESLRFFVIAQTKLCGYEEGKVNNDNEEKKSQLLSCCLVHVNRKCGSGMLTGCLDK
jgi:hypothetical protein